MGNGCDAAFQFLKRIICRMNENVFPARDIQQDIMAAELLTPSLLQAVPSFGYATTLVLVIEPGKLYAVA
jgi:hypothetical protein